jgi:hypothetical protein
MYNGKLIGDLFDAVERAQSSVDCQRQKDEALSPHSEAIHQNQSDSPAKDAIVRTIPADA